MANSGNSKDYKLFREYLRKDKLIPCFLNDTQTHLMLKLKINDFIEKHGYNIKQYGYSNIIIKEQENLVIKINQIRQKYWFFESLKIK